MKMHFTLSNIFIILLCLSSIVFAQLNGPYTIGSTGDFADFTEAVDSLESQGVDGPVVFDVQDGIYEEQMEINYITGASETNTITFQSESGDSTTVVLKYEASSNDNNFIVKLNGGSYITFRGIRLKTAEATYGKAVELDGSSQNITFTNCYFTGIYNTNRSAPYFLVNSSSAGNDNLTFQYCFIDSAAIFIYLQGVEANTNDNIRLIGNTIQNIGYAGLECSNVSRLIVQDNVIDAHSYGLRINSCYAGSIIRGNKMYSDNWGMYINGHGSGLSHCLVANNFIFSASQEAVTARGEYLDIYNNSIYSSNSYWLNKGLWLITDMQNYEINIVNNNICNMKAGLALRVDYGASINNCSNNNLYTPGNFLAYWDSVKCIDLAELQLKSAMNENSLTVYPNFVSDTDLHLVGAWLDGKGSPIAEITDDIDGETRDGSNPDIGADEYNPGIVPTLSGTYTIGSGGDYSSIQEAADDASLKGISASVTFNILPGAYNEQIDIHSIPGASSNNRVTFRSSTGDTTDVKITFANAIYDSNYTIRNFGADFISYENLTFESNTSGYARILDLYRGSDSIEVRNCHFIGLKSNGNESLYAGDSYYRSRIVEGNLFTGNRYAIYMRRNQNGDELTNGTQIIDNTMEDVTHTGIYLQWHYAPIINQNNIRIASDGIALHTCDGPYKVTNNRIESWTSGTGIYVSTSTASELQPGLIANNFISATSANGNNVGISIGNCIYQDVLYNSVNLMSNYYDNRAIELNTGTAQNINIQNNN
ncbi:MAG: right-handed parallel beta-helix repeat-containing protein [Calditrichaceae bacterium]